jgi:hypothetical protein
VSRIDSAYPDWLVVPCVSCQTDQYVRPAGMARFTETQVRCLNCTLDQIRLERRA